MLRCSGGNIEVATLLRPLGTADAAAASWNSICSIFDMS
jgi:hypothetical protein